MKGTKINLFLYWATCTVNLLTLCTAIAMAWASPALPILRSDDKTINPLGRPITTLEESWIASLPSIGCVLGSIIAGFVTQKLGRKITLLIFSIPFFGTYIAISLAKNISIYFICRFLVGVSAGGSLAVIPVYVAEIADDSNRAIMGCIMGILGSLGYTLVYAVGPRVSIQFFAYLQLIPISLFYIMFIPFIPESPYYYIKQNNMTKAEASLKRMRISEDISSELKEIVKTVEKNESVKTDWREIYSTKAARKGLTITCGLLMLQQLLGFSAVLSYMQTIFAASKTSIPTDTASMIIGFVQIFSNIISTLTVNKLGRKILLLASNAGCSISLISLGIYFLLKDLDVNTEPIFFLPILSLVLFFSSYNFGFGTLPLVICGELFSENIKSLAASLSTCVCLTFSFIVTLCFPYLTDLIGMTGSFWLFGAMSMVSITFVVLVVPETMNKSFNEIQDMLNR